MSQNPGQLTPKKWGEAMKQLYEGIYGNSAGFPSWPRDSIFPRPPPDVTETTIEAAYEKLWKWVYTPLETREEGYRLGYAIQVLSMINPIWVDVRDGVSRDEDLERLLVHLDYVLNIPDMENDENAKKLCDTVLQRLFPEGPDRIDREELKEDLDRYWGGEEVYEIEKYGAIRIALQNWARKELPFSEGMRQAKRDLAKGLDSSLPPWNMSEKNEDDWELRHSGSVNFKCQ
ncbi:hypothetical protein B0T20DRAFT_409967 [Sordaria brevicollis]|uniref:Uncharacterized protein n=1 Tax=Sordaria brevicollis TaxID=83679 RepID=A0AAE0PG98_SORBR|nr:hypothetical protein B0T20DRAFT_409967 [Sordaria brevicollis]